MVPIILDSMKIESTTNSNDFFVFQRKNLMPIPSFLIMTKFIFKSNVIMVSQQPFVFYLDCIDNIFWNPSVLTH